MKWIYLKSTKTCNYNDHVMSTRNALNYAPEVLPVSEKQSLLLFTRVWACCGDLSYYFHFVMWSHTLISKKLMTCQSVPCSHVQTVLRHSSQSCHSKQSLKSSLHFTDHPELAVLNFKITNMAMFSILTVNLLFAWILL